MATLLTVQDAADRLGVSNSRVRQLLLYGPLKGKGIKAGRDWRIRPEDLEAVRDRRPPGRPRLKAPWERGQK